MELLDITTLKTVEDINAADFSKFADDKYKTWVRHIVYPVRQKELDRVCELATKSDKIGLKWSMGDLFFRSK